MCGQGGQRCPCSMRRPRVWRHCLRGGWRSGGDVFLRWFCYCIIGRTISAPWYNGLPGISLFLQCGPFQGLNILYRSQLINCDVVLLHVVRILI